MTSKTLLTDLYQLTMMAAYVDNQKDDDATFDLFIRKLPQDWGYFIANGIEDAIEYAANIHFTDEDREYLRSIRLFSDDFIEWLKEFRFQGDIYAVPEGTPVTANTPLLRVTGKRTQAQFLESALLNIINFQTMIATKANRVVLAAGDAKGARHLIRVKCEQSSGRRSRTKGSTRARRMKPPFPMAGHYCPRNPIDNFIPSGHRCEQHRAGRALPFPHRQQYRNDAGARMRTGALKKIIQSDAVKGDAVDKRRMAH